MRNSLFGAKAGVYKENGEDYDINVRLNEDLRYDKNALFNQNIIFRDQATGKLKEIPVSAVAKRINTSSFSAIKHRDTKRIVTVYSALAPGYNDAGAVVSQIKNEMENFSEIPRGIKIDYTGQIEEETKQQAFLNLAFIGRVDFNYAVIGVPI